MIVHFACAETAVVSGLQSELSYILLPPVRLLKPKFICKNETQPTF
jgi:hypothetical protein